MANGHIPMNGGVRITAHEKDAPYEIERMRLEGTIVSDFVKYKSKKDGKGVDFMISAGRPNLPQWEWFKKVGLCGKNAHTKFIPKEALFANVEYRRNLLSGLIDGDGCLATKRVSREKTPRAVWEYSTVSKQLSEDVYFLVHSLGGYCNISNSIAKLNGKEFKYFRMYISLDESLPVALWRKHGSGPRNGLKNMREELASDIGFYIKEEESPCTVYGFTLDSPSQWYITNNFIVTHNSGKTTLALELVAEAQKMGKKCVYVDSEHCFDPLYAKNLHVNLNELLICQPSSAEEAMDIVETFIKEGDIGLIVVDSVAAMTVQAEIDGDMGASSIGLLARLMGRALRKITSLKTNASIIFINQVRDNINTFGYGEQTITPGGQALKFFSSIRVEMKRSAKLTKGDVVIGNQTKVKVTKNKLASPFKSATFNIMYGTGTDAESDLIAFGIEKEVLKKEGNTIFFGDLKLGGSLNAVKKFLEENVEIFEKIKEAINKIE